MEDLDLRDLADIPDPFAEATDLASLASSRPGPPREKPAAPSAARARVRWLRGSAVVMALLSEVGWLALVEHRPDLEAVSPAGLLLGIGVPLLAAAVALAAAMRPGALGLGESVARQLGLIGLSFAVFVVGTLLASPADTEGPFWGHALRCMGVTAVLAAAPLALGVRSLRHAFAAASTWRSLGLGVAAGALASATMSLACSTDGVLHVLVAHGAMMLVGGAAGAAFGRATRA